MARQPRRRSFSRSGSFRRQRRVPGGSRCRAGGGKPAGSKGGSDGANAGKPADEPSAGKPANKPGAGKSSSGNGKPAAKGGQAGKGGVELAYTDFRGALSIGLPRGWTEEGTTGDGAVLLRPESGRATVEVFYEPGSSGDIGNLADGAAGFLAGRNAGEQPGSPKVSGGAAEIRAPYSSGYELARLSQQGGQQIFAIGTVPDGTDNATAAEVAAVVRGVKGS